MYQITTFENGKRLPRFRQLTLAQARCWTRWLERNSPETQPIIEFEDEVGGMPETAKQTVGSSFEAFASTLSQKALMELAIQQHLQLLDAQTELRAVREERKEQRTVEGEIRLTPKGNGAFEIEIRSLVPSSEVLSDFLFAFSEAISSVAKFD